MTHWLLGCYSTIPNLFAIPVQLSVLSFWWIIYYHEFDSESHIVCWFLKYTLYQKSFFLVSMSSSWYRRRVRAIGNPESVERTDDYYYCLSPRLSTTTVLQTAISLPRHSAPQFSSVLIGLNSPCSLSITVFSDIHSPLFYIIIVGFFFYGELVDSTVPVFSSFLTYCFLTK